MRSAVVESPKLSPHSMASTSFETVNFRSCDFSVGGRKLLRSKSKGVRRQRILLPSRAGTYIGTRSSAQPLPKASRGTVSYQYSAPSSSHLFCCISLDSVHQTARRRATRRVALHALSSAVPTSDADTPSSNSDFLKIVGYTAGIMFLFTAQRNIFSAVAMTIVTDLGVSMTTLGIVSSSFLWGYGIMQLPAGISADRFGGPRVLLFGLLGSCVSLLLAACCMYTPWPLMVLVASRILMGMVSAVALPATAATMAKFAPPSQRAGATSLIYCFFNVGFAAGITYTTAITSFAGWPMAYGGAALMGLVYLCIAWRGMPAYAFSKSSCQLAAAGKAAGRRDGGGGEECGSVSQALWKMSPGQKVQVLGLMYTHVAIGAGVHIMQNWIPTFFVKELGTASMQNVGIMSALPWLVTAAVTYNAGMFADWLLNDRKWDSVKVRQLMMTISTAGPALCLFALVATLPLKNMTLSTALLMGMLGAQACNYAGFHTYLQEVAGRRSGFLLSITNSCGILAGTVGNIAAGWLFTKYGSFSALFVYVGLLYTLSAITWNVLMKGEKLFDAPRTAS